ncbi:hypothetical protein KVR01_009432 [Diaporthe batatas]|uniref:uncharacterized protein n=1 Tax=Diaporthe batatas TaxID=748121 RepID=UPI001D03EF2C|nr:uncharacterized protein KVR01_009432 [Diaporthe batatas]KAG8161168.1 hypothetical protein KVR01_009432 [Diaporthe batatas]
MSCKPLKGRLAILTGASGTIGTAIAANLAAKGCNLVLSYFVPESAPATEDLSEALQSKYGIKAFDVRGDLATPTGPADLVRAVKKHFTEREPNKPFQIDILLNVAGIALNNKLPEIKVSEFDTTFRINVLAPLMLVQAVQPHLPTDRSGRIISVSSISAHCGFVGQAVYGGTKSAIEGMTRVWARELAEHATVNCVTPGPVEGPLYASNTDEFKREAKGWIEHTPLMRVRSGIDPENVIQDAKTTGGRPAYANEVAGIIAMLCLPDAAWCTGQVVCANGGMLM